MKKHFYLICATALFCTQSFAQAPLTVNDVETDLGVEFSFNNMQSGDAGTAGNDQLWDFTFLTPENVQNYEIVEFGSTGNEDLFPNANTALSVGFGVSYEYLSITDEAYAAAGQYAPGSYEAYYTNPQSLIVFPAELGVTFVDSFAFNYVINGTAGDMVGEVDMEVDGYGDISMPWGTVEGAYRVSGSIDRLETVEIDGETVQAFLNGTTTHFFAPGFPSPVISVLQAILTVPAFDVIQNIQSTTYISGFEPVGTDDLVVDGLSVYPNPASDHITINFEKRDAQPLQVDLLNVQGRVVQSAGQIGSGFGTFQSQIDVSKLPAGFYLLRLAAGESSQVVKVAVN